MNNIIPLFWIIILCMIFTPSYQATYLCNPNSECGCSTKPAIIARIVNGEESVIGSWGWTVSLSIKDDYLCGGSILSSSWIITAAHCVDKISASNIIVYAGSNIRWSSTQNQTVSEVIVHSAFNSETYINDIALLRLTSPLNMDDPSLSSICIGSINSRTSTATEWPAPDTPVVAVGWGKLAETGQFAKNLQQVFLKIIDYRASTCSNVLNDSHLQLCASVPDGSKDTCQGDSGGPLMMFTSNKQWLLIGLTSYGEGCARKGYSGVYTRVAVFEDWIRLHTNGAYSKLKSFSDTAAIHSWSKSYANTIFIENYHIFFSILLLFYCS